MEFYFCSACGVMYNRLGGESDSEWKRFILMHQFKENESAVLRVFA